MPFKLISQSHTTMSIFSEGIVESIAASVLSGLGANLDGPPKKQFTAGMTGNCKLTASGSIAHQRFDLITTISSLKNVGLWQIFSGSFELLDTVVTINVAIPGEDGFSPVVINVDKIICATSKLEDGSQVKTYQLGTVTIAIANKTVVTAYDFSATSFSDVLKLGNISLQNIRLPQILIILRILHPYMGTEALPCNIEGVESFAITGCIKGISVDFMRGCHLSISGSDGKSAILLESVGKSDSKLIEIQDLEVCIRDQEISASVCRAYLTAYKLGIVYDYIAVLIPGIKFQENVPTLPLNWKINIERLETILHSEDTDIMVAQFYPLESQMGAVRIGKIKVTMDEDVICESNVDNGSCSSAAVRINPIIQMISTVGNDGKAFLQSQRSFIVDVAPFDINIDISQLSYLLHLHTVRNKCSDAHALLAAVLLIMQQHDARAETCGGSYGKVNIGDREDFAESQVYFSCMTNTVAGTLRPSIMKNSSSLKKKVSFIDQKINISDQLMPCSHIKLHSGTVVKLTSRAEVQPDGSVFKMRFSEQSKPLIATCCLGEVVFEDVGRTKQRLSISTFSYAIDYEEAPDVFLTARLDVSDISVDKLSIKSLTGPDDLEVTCNIEGCLKITLSEIMAMLPLRFMTQFYIDQYNIIMDQLEEDSDVMANQSADPLGNVTTKVFMKKGVVAFCTAPLMLSCAAVEIATESTSSDFSVLLTDAKILEDGPISISSLTFSYQPSNSKLGIVITSFVASEGSANELLVTYDRMKHFLPNGSTDTQNTATSSGSPLVLYLVVKGFIVEIPGAVLDVNRINLKIDPEKKLIHLKKYLDGYDMHVYAAVKDFKKALSFVTEVQNKLSYDSTQSGTSNQTEDQTETGWEIEGKSVSAGSFIFDIDDCFDGIKSTGVVRFSVNGLSLKLSSGYLEFKTRLTLAYDPNAVVGSNKIYRYHDNLVVSKSENRLFDISWEAVSVLTDGVFVTTTELLQTDNVMLSIPSDCCWRLLMLSKNIISAISSEGESEKPIQLSKVPIPGADPYAGMPKFRFVFPKPFSVTLSLVDLRKETFSLRTMEKDFTVSELCNLYMVVWDRLVSFYGFAITVVSLPGWLLRKILGVKPQKIASAADIDITNDRKHLDVMSIPRPQGK